MSSSYYRKKSFPLSLALGITHALNDNDDWESNFLSPLSLQDQKTFLLNTNDLVTICFNPHPKERKPNPTLFSLAVRRVLALKSHSPFPVIIVVKNRDEGRAFAEELERFASIGKLYNMIYTIKDKFSKQFLTNYHTEADFILLTYHKLREIVFKKACPATEQIVFINPLTKYRCAEEVIFLDDIIGGLHRHKCRKPHFSYMFDCAAFPLLTQEEYRELLNVEHCLFFQCEEPKRGYYNNTLKDRLTYLTDEHIQFFSLRELFRGRKNLKELVERFKKTITYKLHLYSNNLYPSLFSPSYLPKEFNPIIEKKLLEKKAFMHINSILNLFCKRVTKTITGRINYNDSLGEEKLFEWNEPIETAPFLQLVEKKQDRNYYLTSLGEAVLISTSNREGIRKNFSDFLIDLAKTLYKNKDPAAKFSLKEIIDFYCILTGNDPVELPEQLNKQLINKRGFNTKEFNDLLERFIEQRLSYKISNYEGLASIQILGAFEELMDVQALHFFQRLKEYKKEKKQSLKDKLQDEILKLAQYDILTVKFLCQKYWLDYQHVKKVLEKLVSEELLVTIRTVDCSGKVEVKYCTQKLLENFPYLKKICGKCKFYNKQLKTCSFLRLVAVNTPSAFPTEYQNYIRKPIKENTSACEFHEDEGDFEFIENKMKFTLTQESLTLKMQKFTANYILGQTPQTVYLCLACQKVIEEFGSEKELFFPRKRVSCPNCATAYLQRANQKIVIQIEQRHLLRMKYYQLTGSVPKILEEKDPSYAFVIYDTENVELEKEEDDNFILVIDKQKIPLVKVQYIFFAGKRYKVLEEVLLNLEKIEPNKYHYAIKRAGKETEVEDHLTDEQGIQQTYSSEKYQFLQGLFTFLQGKEVFNSPIATTRHLSNIAGILHIRNDNIERDEPIERINRQLYEMIDLLLRIQTGVRTSYYGRQLEALSNNFFFELVKEEGVKVGLWTYGRVSSRLVKDMSLSFSKKNSNAYAPFDVLLNQLVKVFRSKIDLLFQKIGLDPAKLGQGLYHRRKTKSDIDKLGLYFDLIEPVRVLVLIVFYKAMKEGTLSVKDSTLVLGGNAQEIFQVQFASLDKINQIAEEALNMKVLYDGQIFPFLQAFERYLQSFRQAIENCYEQSNMGKKYTAPEIIQLFRDSNFWPFVFCPEKFVKELMLVNKFTTKFSDFHVGVENLVLKNTALRDSTREQLMAKWLQSNKKRGEEKISLTAYQKVKQERSLLVILLLLYRGLQNDLLFSYYPTADFQIVLGLTQNQVQRLLAGLDKRGLLTKEKVGRICYYQLNLENSAIHELLFSVGLIPCDNEKQKEILERNSLNVLTQVTKLTDKYLNAIHLNHKPCWSGWHPSISIQSVLNWLQAHLVVCKQKFTI